MNVLFSYFTPASALPLASTAAAAGGLVLMFGRVSLRAMRRRFRKSLGQSGAVASEEARRYRRV